MNAKGGELDRLLPGEQTERASDVEVGLAAQQFDRPGDVVHGALVGTAQRHHDAELGRAVLLGFLRRAQDFLVRQIPCRGDLGWEA